MLHSHLTIGHTFGLCKPIFSFFAVCFSFCATLFFPSVSAPSSGKNEVVLDRKTKKALEIQECSKYFYYFSRELRNSIILLFVKSVVCL